MPSRQICLAFLAAAWLCLAAPGAVYFRDKQRKLPRVRTAARDKDEPLKQLLRSHGLGYPPKAILLRAFKKESELELWVENSKGTYILVKKYSICATVWGSRSETPLRRWTDA